MKYVQSHCKIKVKICHNYKVSLHIRWLHIPVFSESNNYQKQNIDMSAIHTTTFKAVHLLICWKNNMVSARMGKKQQSYCIRDNINSVSLLTKLYAPVSITLDQLISHRDLQV